MFLSEDDKSEFIKENIIIPYKFKIIYYCVSNGWIAPAKCV